MPAGFARPLVFAMVEVAGLRVFAPLVGVADPAALAVGAPRPVRAGPGGRRSAGEAALPAGLHAGRDARVTDRPLRVLIAKPGLDGHDRGAKVVAHALRDAGIEVVYSGLKRTPDELVAEAVQEDVDVIGLSVLSGAHLTLSGRLLERLRAADAGDVAVVVGGTIPARDAAALRAMGVHAVFPMGTPLPEIVSYFRAFRRADA